MIALKEPPMITSSISVKSTLNKTEFEETSTVLIVALGNPFDNVE